MKKILSVLIFASAALWGTLAMAQVPASFPVELVQPDNWTVDQSDKTENRIIAYVDPANDNRIEVLARNVVRDTHATQLFEEFDKQLVSSSFRQNRAPSEKSIPLTVSNQERKGQWAEYEFKSSSTEVPITVVTFAFTAQGKAETKAIILVGYFATDNKDAGLSAFNAMISKMADKAAE